MAITTTTWTTLGTIAMTLGTIYPLAKAVRDPKNRRYYAILSGVTGIAAVAYLTMTLGIGDVVVDGGTVPVPRYVDWLLTTPLLLWYVGLLAGASRRRLAELVALDVVVLGAGTAAIAATGLLSWGLFLAGVVAFLGIVRLLAWTVPAEAQFPTATVRATFVKLRNLTVVLWSLYPVAWLLGPPGAGLLDGVTTMQVIMYLDFVSKVVFVVVAVNAADALDDLDSAAAAAAPGDAGGADAGGTTTGDAAGGDASTGDVTAD